MWALRVLLVNVLILAVVGEGKKERKGNAKGKEQNYDALPQFKKFEDYKEVITALLPDFQVFLSEEEEVDELDFNDFLSLFKGQEDEEVDTQLHQPT